MQVIKTETVVYEFSELSEQAKQKAIENMHNINVDYEWWDSTIEQITEALESIGFSGVNVSFSGFWSQGDGASFTGQYSYEKGALAKVRKEFPQWEELHNLAETLQELNKQYFYSLRFELARICHHYNHENTVSLSWSECDTNADGRPSDETDELIIEDCRAFMQEIYSMLKKEYEYLNSDESIIEKIESNGYQFTEDGVHYG